MKRFNNDIKRLKLLSTGTFCARKNDTEKFSNDAQGDLFFFAGISDEGKRKIFIKCCLSGLILLCISLYFTKIYIALGVVVLYVFFEYLNIRNKVYKRVQNFEQDYPAFLISLSSSIKGGKDPFLALITVKELFSEESILRKKLEEMLDNIQKGASEEEAIFSFATDIKHPDIDLFRVAFILSRREGSGLYGPLKRLTKVTRQRQSFRRKTQSAVAMQKMSAYGILASGIFIAFIQFIMNKNNFMLAFSDPLGIRLMLAGGLFLLIGIVWMMYMTREKI